ncbi:MAG TPA: DNA polymerase III subunit beta, partial [Phycisphaerales bacterium]|nr:DNA polymerase III subunit beta [Phycisphaerales bacterium]
MTWQAPRGAAPLGSARPARSAAAPGGSTAKPTGRGRPVSRADAVLVPAIPGPRRGAWIADESRSMGAQTPLCKQNTAPTRRFLRNTGPAAVHFPVSYRRSPHMKVLCDRGALLDAINLISGVVASRTPRLQLTCVKLTAAKDGNAGRLMLEATDAEISMTLDTERVDVEEPGEALVPADMLQKVVRAEENEPTLTIEAEEDVTRIRGADAEFELRGFPPDEFPDVPGFGALKGDAPSFTINAGALEDLVQRSLFAAARENSRYAINGVLLRRDGKTLEFVATDGRRLALCRDTLDADGDEVTCIIPSKALNTLTKLIQDPEEPVAVCVTDNRIVFGFSPEDGGGRALLA